MDEIARMEERARFNLENADKTGEEQAELQR